MIREFRAAPIAGNLSAPPSKSAAHRALLTAALAGGGSVRSIAEGDDIAATCRALPALGAHYLRTGNTITITKGSLPEAATVNCGESGSTLRFLLPLLAVKGINAAVSGKGRLPFRPLGVYDDLFPAHGVTVTHGTNICLPLTLSGRLTGGAFLLPGDISSQFISGLLMALPLCDSDSVIRLTTPCESVGYVEMTLQTLARHGIAVEPVSDGWHIPGQQSYRLTDETVEGDWSQAAVLLAAGAVAGHVNLSGLDAFSLQGDRAVVDLLRQFGASVEWAGDTLACYSAPLRGIMVDVSQTPDLAPVLAVLGACAEGETHIVGAGRLRLKESDRLAACADVLSALGVRVTAEPDTLHIVGGRFHGGTVDGHGDHRIVMAMAVAALRATSPVRIRGAEAVNKSWPNFFNDFAKIGGMSHVVVDR